PPAGLVGDEEYYWQDYADAVVHGRNLTLAQQIRPPLWGLVLSLPHRLGDDPVSGRVLDAVPGSPACGGVFAAARRAYGPRAGLAAGLVQALLPEHGLFSTYLWSEVLFGLLLAVGCLVYFARPAAERRLQDELLAFGIMSLAFLAKELAV